MTRNLFVLYNETNVELLYANGITFYPRDICHLKTVQELSQILRHHGYVEPGTRCNPEVLDYVTVVTEWTESLLIFCSDEEESENVS